MTTPFLTNMPRHVRLRVFFEQHRKNINENLGLIVALLAAGFAGWTGYEARHARLDAHADAIYSLKIAQRSYVEVEDVSLLLQGSVSESKGKPPSITALYRLKIYGNSPAFDISAISKCGKVHYRLDLFDGGSHIRMASAEDYSGEFERYIRNGDPEGYLRLIEYRGTLTPGASTEIRSVCDGKEDLTEFGTISYRDIFGDSHARNLCYELKTNLDEIQVPPGAKIAVGLFPCRIFNDSK